MNEAEARVRAALEVDADRWDVHRLVLAHGVAHTPVARRADVTPGARHDAFRNAFGLARERDWSYCEGYTLPRGLWDHPNRHAWCLDSEGGVVDPSPGWADPGGPLRECYFGIALPLDLAAPYLERSRMGVLYERTGQAPALATELGLASN